MPILLGAVADDFTGATDLCNTLVRGGMRTVQPIGVPPEGAPRPGRRRGRRGAEVAHHARRPRRWRQSLAALAWLRRRRGAQILLQVLLDLRLAPTRAISARWPRRCWTRSASDFTIACPAFPETGRTIYQGHLFVGDVLLSDTGMRDHPLTPMRDANLVRVLAAPDAGARSASCRYDTVAPGPAAIARRASRALRARRRAATPIVDAIDDDDLRTLGAACADLPLVTGGSGIAIGLPENFRRAGLLPAAQRRRRAAARRRAARPCSPAPARRRRARRSQRWPRGIRRCKLDPLRRPRRARSGDGARLGGRAAAARAGPGLRQRAARGGRARRRSGSARERAGALVEDAAGGDRARASSSAACGASSSPAARPRARSSRRWASRRCGSGRRSTPACRATVSLGEPGRWRWR